MPAKHPVIRFGRFYAQGRFVRISKILRSFHDKRVPRKTGCERIQALQKHSVQIGGISIACVRGAGKSPGSNGDDIFIIVGVKSRLTQRKAKGHHQSSTKQTIKPSGTDPFSPVALHGRMIPPSRFAGLRHTKGWHTFFSNPLMTEKPAKLRFRAYAIAKMFYGIPDCRILPALLPPQAANAFQTNGITTA